MSKQAAGERRAKGTTPTRQTKDSFLGRVAKTLQQKKAHRRARYSVEATANDLLIRSASADPGLMCTAAGKLVKGTIKSVRASLLERLCQQVGIDPKRTSLVLRHTSRRGRLDVSSWTPTVGGLPVDGAHIALAIVHDGKAGRVVAFKSDSRVPSAVEGAHKLSDADVMMIAAKLHTPDDDFCVAAVKNRRFKIEKIAALDGSSLRAAYRATPMGVVFKRSKNGHVLRDRVVIVDGETGAVLSTRTASHTGFPTMQRDDTRIGLVPNPAVDAKKHVALPPVEHLVSAFDQDPVTSPRNIDRVTQIVTPRKILLDYRLKPILRNAFFDVIPGRYAGNAFEYQVEEKPPRATGQFEAKWDQLPLIAETNTYVHLTRVRAFFETIDPQFTVQTPSGPGGQDDPLRVWVDVDDTNINGIARPGEIILTMSTPAGGYAPSPKVSAGTSAEIVAHEYGHQVHFALAPNLNDSSTSEAIADFFSMIYAHNTAASEIILHGFQEMAPPSPRILRHDYITQGIEYAPPGMTAVPYYGFAGIRDGYNDCRFPEDYGDEGHSNGQILCGAWIELHHEIFQQFHGADYLAVARMVLWSLPFFRDPIFIPDYDVPPWNSRWGLGHWTIGIQDAAADFVAFVAAAADAAVGTPEEVLYAAIAEESVRIFERRGLI